MARRPALPGLSQSQREIMEIVWQRGEVSAVDVRAALTPRRDLAKNTVRTLLERMEADGLVGRQRSTTDRRRTLVRLTPAGARAWSAAASVRQAALAGLLDKFEGDPALSLEDALDRLVRGLEAGQ